MFASLLLVFFLPPSYYLHEQHKTENKGRRAKGRKPPQRLCRDFLSRLGRVSLARIGIGMTVAVLLGGRPFRKGRNSTKVSAWGHLRICMVVVGSMGEDRMLLVCLSLSFFVGFLISVHYYLAGPWQLGSKSARGES
jgi:hypothetical protein